MDVAVLVDDEGHITQFEQGGIIKVYTKANDGWQTVRQIDYTIEGLDNPRALSSRISELCEWMAPCKILAAGKFRGTYRVWFERYQVAMWEMNGFSHMCVQDFLDSIHLFYTQEEEPHTDPKLAEEVQAPTPVEVHAGYFSVDLGDVMARRTSLNSKQVLFPFFQNTTFTELEILCEHVPKWFENELPQLNLVAKEEKYEDRVRIKVFPVSAQ